MNKDAHLTRMMRYFLLGLCALVGLNSYAQKTYRFESITVSNGLSQSSITSIAQDELGYLWVGTQDGLNKFDGYTIKVYRNKHGDTKSLSQNYVTNILVDKTKTIWIATLGHLSKYDPATDGFINYPLAVADVSLGADTYIRAICESRDGALVLATNRGIIHFDRSTHTFSIRKDFRKFSGLWVNNYVETKKAGDWLFMPDSALQKMPGEQKWRKHRLRGLYTYYDQLKDQLYFYSGIPDDTNEILKYDAGGKWVKWASSPNPRAEAMALGFLRNRKIWVATEYGILIYTEDGKLLESLTTSETLESPIAMYETRDGVIWLGTNGYGLKKYNPQTNQFNYVGTSMASSISLHHNYVDAIFTNNDTTVYVLTANGLDKLDLYKRTSTHLKIPERFYAITPDTKGQLWFSNNNGLWLLKNSQFIDANLRTPGVGKISPSSPIAFCWQGKVLYLDKNEKQTVVELGSDDDINTCKLFGDSLWIGLAYGPVKLKLFIMSTRSFADDFVNDGQDANEVPGGGGIKCIFQDSKKRTWIGSNGDGLSLYHPKEKKFTHFTEKDGLPNNTIYGILEDENHNLWLSTNKGLCEFNPETKKVRNFEAFDGLQSNEFNTGAFFKSKRGIMYFGGVNGLTYFNPRTIETISTLPHSVISGYYVNSKLLSDYSSYVQISEGESTFSLQYSEGDFGFDFVGVGFSLPGRTKYRYMLENYDKEWHDIGNIPHINFTNIPPGEYIFRVKSSDPYGNWETTGASVTIRIEAPFWKKPDVWVLALTLFAVALVAIYYGRIRSLKRNALRLTGMVNERTLEIQKQNKENASQNQELLSQAAILEEKNNELEKAKGLLEIEVKYLHQRQLLKSSIDVQEDERKRIAQDLHDELGAVLSIARMHLVQIQQEEGESIDRKAALQQAQTLTESALATMRRISHELMPPQLEEFGLIKTLRAIAVQTNAARQIKLELIADDDLPRWPLAIELGLYRICMEMINNTIKHAEARKIYIQLNQHTDAVVCSYSDDGKGLPEKYTEGHGFKNIEARLNSLGGSITIGNQSTGGFYALLKIPLRRVHSNW